MVSVVVPIYNGEKYIKDCVDSLINQTYKNIEIILVNDGSTDNTAAVLDEIKNTDNRIRVIHKENGGVSSARNAGIDASNGKYIMFCDCDDIPMKDWCGEFVKCAELYPDSLPICGMKVLFPDGYEYTQMLKKQNDEVYSRYNVVEAVESCMHALFGPYTKIYLSDIVKNNVSFDTDICYGEDLNFNLDYLLKNGGKIVAVNKVLYNYLQQNPNSATQKYTVFDTAVLEKTYSKFKLLFEQCIQSNQELPTIFYSVYFDLYVDVMSSFSTAEMFKKTERIKRCKEIILSNAFRDCVKNMNASERHPKLLKIAKHKYLHLIWIAYKIYFEY